MRINKLGIVENESLMIVGNGFDLNLGAKTSYEHFYECLKKCYNSASLSDFSICYQNSKNVNSVKMFFECVKKETNNYFVNYFLNYETIFGSWVSFENELSKIISAFDMMVSFLDSASDSFIDQGGNYASLYVCTSNYPKLLSVLNTYPDNRFFKAHTEPQWIIKEGQAVELIIGGGKRKRDLHQLRNSIEKFSESFPFELYADLTSFSNLFSLYLSIVRNSANLNKKMNTFASCRLFLNYNYTKYLEKFLRRNHYEFDKVLYINGKVDRNFKKDSGIVFGIDSNVNLKNTAFSVFTKNLQRSIKKTNINEFDRFANESITNFYIFGHSLSLSDYESLNYLFSAANKRDPVIHIFYYDDASKASLIINLKTILGDKLFSEYQRRDRIVLLPFNEA